MVALTVHSLYSIESNVPVTTFALADTLRNTSSVRSVAWLPGSLTQFLVLTHHRDLFVYDLLTPAGPVGHASLAAPPGADPASAPCGVSVRYVIRFGNNRCPLSVVDDELVAVVSNAGPAMLSHTSSPVARRTCVDCVRRMYSASTTAQSGLGFCTVIWTSGNVVVYALRYVLVGP